MKLKALRHHSISAFIFFMSIALAIPAYSQVLDSVELEGITQFTQQDVEGLLEIGPGDFADSSKIAKTSENLKNFYRSKGYESARVLAKLDSRKKTNGTQDRVLVYEVVEGPVTQVANLSIEVNPGRFQKRAEQILSRLSFVPGVRLDKEKLANFARQLEDQFAAMGYFSVKVTETQRMDVSEAEAKSLNSIKENSSAQLKGIKFVVKLGDRVAFGFRGNDALSHLDLMSFIEDERQLGLAEEYVSKIQTRLESEYQKRGYARVQIEASTFEAEKDGIRRVRYEISEGPLVKIAHVKFEGVSFFFQRELEKKFYQLAGPLLKQRVYAPKEVEQAADLVAEWIRKQGFLSSKISSIQKVDTPNSKGKIDLVIYLNEGERTIVQDVLFEGLKFFKEEELLEILALKKLEPFNIYAFNDGVELLERKFKEEGFWDAKIVNIEDPDLVRYESDNHFAYIRLKIFEGPRYVAGNISVNGVRKTKEVAVMRELVIERGDVLRDSEIQLSEQRLRRLGIFSTVKIEQIDSVHPGTKDLIIQVEETSPGVISGGIGARNDLGARAFGQISYANLLGLNHTLAFQINANRRFKQLGGVYCANQQQRDENPTKDWCFIEFDTSVSYLYPWFLGKDLKFRPSLTASRTQFVRFDADTLALQVSVQKRFARYQPLSLALTYSLERTDQYNAINDIDNQKLRIGAIIPAVVLDLRNSDIAPSKGIYSTLTYELSRPEFFSQKNPFPVSYQRTQGRIDGYAPGPFQSVGYLSFRTGIESNFSKPPPGAEGDPRYAIPLIKQFSLGGVSSLRGFREQSLVISDDTAVTGYASYVNYRAQIDVPFTGSIRLGPFLDAANLNVDSYNLTRLRYGTGVGLKYMSPLGPVNFDIGVNPRPRPGEDGYRIHFSIGTL